jgi:uncharacterized membrane protein YbhN (UPF0104 family)
VRIVSMKTFGPLLRLVIAASVLFLIVRHVGLQSVLLRLEVAQSGYLIGAAVLLLADSFIRIWNWQQILRALGVRVPSMYRKLTASYFSGGFLGTVVPSTAGTDALRAIFSAYLFRGHVAFFSGPIVTLNILGLTAGCSLGILGIVLLSSHGYAPYFLGASAGVFMAVVLGAIIVQLILKYRRDLLVLFLRLFSPRWFRIRRIARQFLGTLHVFAKKHVHFAPIFAVAASSQFLQAMLLLLVAKAASVELPLGSWLMLAPLAALARLIPMSIAGFGGEQVALVYLIAPFGVPGADAIVISLAYATLQLLTNVVVGGPAFLMISHRLRKSA